MKLENNDESDRTVFVGNAPALETSGDATTAMPGADNGSGNVLPPGTRINEFEIIQLIGEGGFGIVYRAYDHSLERQVALKEYMPAGLASRTRTMRVTVRSQACAETFKAGLRSFINEARFLAQFDSPSLVKVFRFWESADTAYMVMPYYEGITLRQAFREHRIEPTEGWLKSLLVHLCDAIEMIHHVNCYHRDIAPDNILLLKDGRPLLLDFGAARRVITDTTQGPTAIVKAGFAPMEQYANVPGMKQGPWTDVYALAAVVYYLITGMPPSAAIARYVNDEMTPASKAGEGRYSRSFLAALDHALAVKPEKRIQNIPDLRRALDIDDNVPKTMPPVTVAAKKQASHAPNVAAGLGALWENAKTRRSPGRPSGTQRVEPVFAPSPELRSDSKPLVSSQASRVNPPYLTAGLVGFALFAGTSYLALRTTTNPATPPVATVPSEQIASATASATPVAELPKQTPKSVAPTQMATPLPLPRPALLPKPQPVPLNQASAPPKRPAAATLLEHSPDPRGVPTVTPSPTPSQGSRVSPHDALWTFANAANNVAGYESYLKQYPNGPYAAVASIRLARLRPGVAPPGVQPSPETGPATGRPGMDRQPGPVPAIDKTIVAIAPATSGEAPLPKPPATGDAYTTTESSSGNSASGSGASSGDSALGGRGASSASDKAPAAAAQYTPALEHARDTPTPLQPSKKVATIKAPEVSSSLPKDGAPLLEGAALPAARSRDTIKVGNQTFTGDFAIDPLTSIVSGKGRILWNNGDRFDGTLIRGVKEGDGEFVWANGQRYKGHWSHGEPNGAGTLVFANGDRYVGEVKDGHPSGKGVMRRKNGDVYNGGWLAGKNHGIGRYTWANGSYWDGEFMDDKPTENGKMVFPETPPKPVNAFAQDAKTETNATLETRSEK